MATTDRISWMLLLSLLANYTACVSAVCTNFYLNTSKECPGTGVTCSPGRSMCAHENVNDKNYCCDSLSDTGGNVCYTLSPSCDGSDGGPSSVQQSCSGVGEQVNDITWCCLKDFERCSSRTNQISTCIAIQDNPIALVPEQLVNDTFSSLSSANPSATTYSIDVFFLAARATATTTTSPAATTTDAAPAATSTSSDESGGSTPTGAIAGGVVGGLAVLAVIAGGIWFSMRKRKAGRGKGSYSSPFAGEKYETGSGHPVVEMNARGKLYEADHNNRWETQELTGSGVPELHSKHAGLRELP
ncbi:hypothetical protein CBER1_05633 [Cercospora berteroae]|uniref:Mid2 domain-containing protein n=1 Tax=Cercospora berteroae TaxID=357750 RepID=A0A2S6C5I3_9PEZI|nr:hypothetical protein CBER1_05633 [Cercospora berteroae]